MPSLTERLAALGVQVGTKTIPSPTEKRSTTPALVDLFPGTWEKTSLGECFVVRKEIPLGTSHGKMQISSHPDLRFFDSLDHLSGISNLLPDEFLFIDTETTGLAGGAGTYVFLIGAARYEPEVLHFAQFFLQDPASESAQLAALEEFSASSKAIVSYNGKSFDLPRIRTRYRLHGWPDPFENIFHIDLLHFTRRIWKLHLPSCTLGDLERHILGLERSSLDIPGWKVSEYFFEYLSTQDPTPLESIFYHNEVDVISLVALLEHLALRLSTPLQGIAADQQDLVSVGLYFFSLQMYQEAQEILTAAFDHADHPPDRYLPGKLGLASTYKKLSDSESAAPIWQECAEMGSYEAMIELAKYAEHTLADFESAIHWTLTAFDAIGSFPPPKQPVITDQLNHRLQRLKAKTQR